ncbi:MAG: ABC transporter substrate-binding protein [Candidatus Bathyarchaeia archaeon]
MNRKAVLMAVILLLAPLVAVGTIAIRPATAAVPLKVGVIGPYNLPQWHKEQGGMEGGALLAMMDGLGLINVGGTLYNITLVFADEGAYNPLTGTYDPVRAKNEIRRLLYTEGCKFIIGGFRTEVTWILIEETKGYNDANPGNEVIFLINGASTDALIGETVGADYEGYKWLFRINPINSTMLGRNVFGYLAGYLIPYKLIPMYGSVRVGCLTEDLEWTVGICNFVHYVLPTLFPPGVVTFSGCWRSPSGTTNFVPYLDAAAANNTHVLVIAYTLPDAMYLVQQWREGEYKFLLVGIDVFGQRGEYPSLTGGACEYEIFEDFSGTRTPITPLAVSFWDHYVGNFSSWPIYTAWGAYNAFMVLKKALETAGTLNPAAVITTLEAQETLVLNGKAKFTSIHDVFSNEYGKDWKYGYTRAMMVQWINTGNPANSKPFTHGFIKQVVCPTDQPFSRKTKFPPWIHPLGDVDLNFDGKIDMKDVARVSKAFGSLPGDPRWDLECDVTYDGKIDMKDVATVSKNFGKFVQPWPPDP